MPNQLQEIDMYRDRFEGNWKQFDRKVKVPWGRLINDPQRELAGRIQERYGIAKEEAARQLKDFLDRNRNWDLSNR